MKTTDSVLLQYYLGEIKSKKYSIDFTIVTTVMKDKCRKAMGKVHTSSTEMT